MLVRLAEALLPVGLLLLVCLLFECLLSNFHRLLLLELILFLRVDGRRWRQSGVTGVIAGIGSTSTRGRLVVIRYIWRQCLVVSTRLQIFLRRSRWISLRTRYRRRYSLRGRARRRRLRRFRSWSKRH